MQILFNETEVTAQFIFDINITGMFYMISACQIISTEGLNIVTFLKRVNKTS